MGQSVSQAGGSLAGSGLMVCGMKAYKNCLLLTFLAPLFPPLTVAGEKKSPPGG